MNLFDVAILVVRGASAFGRDHKRAKRRLGSAIPPEDLAVPGLDDAFEHLAALSGFWVGDFQSRN